jgi:hypothetical protein
MKNTIPNTGISSGHARANAVNSNVPESPCDSAATLCPPEDAVRLRFLSHNHFWTGTQLFVRLCGGLARLLH